MRTLETTSTRTDSRSSKSTNCRNVRLWNPISAA
jgi:hypothetical protein